MSRPQLVRWLWWMLGFLAFPLAGIVGGAVAGPVDDLAAALLGGALTGLVVGAGQALAALGALPPVRWIAATTVGMAVGLAAGTAAAGYGTSLGALALTGLVTGAALGLAQCAALPAGSRRWLWALATPPLWALGWTVTTVVGVDVERQYTIFGSTGAVTVTALSGLVLLATTARPAPAVRS